MRRTSRGCAPRAASRPHSAKCAACHQCISRWNLPYQLLKVRPALLRREPAGALDGGEVLREHHAPLQLLPARVPALGEIDRPSGRARNGSSALRVARRVAPSNVGRAARHSVVGDSKTTASVAEALAPARRLTTKLCLAASAQTAARLTRRARVIVVVVQAALELRGALAARSHQRRSVRLRPRPIRRGRRARAVGEVQVDRRCAHVGRAGESTRTATRSGADGRPSPPSTSSPSNVKRLASNRPTDRASARRREVVAVAPRPSALRRRKADRPRCRRCGLARSHSISGVRLVARNVRVADRRVRARRAR